jgi:general secretion pathway protein F
MLGTMLSNGVDLIKGLQLARDSVTLPVIARRLDQVSKLVRGGQPLSQSLASQGLFNDTAVSLIQVGEESGEMPTMLQSLATLYEDLGQQRMKRFLLLLEPLAILSIGGIIGLIVAAIMLAITSVNQVAI